MLWISERLRPFRVVRSVGAPGQLHHDCAPKGAPENDTLRKVKDHYGVGRAEDHFFGVVRLRMTIEDPPVRRYDGLDCGVELRRVLLAKPIALHHRKTTGRSKVPGERGLATAGATD